MFLSGAVLAQSGLFLLVTLWVERPRPDVPHLEPSPPTSSFPSGHVGAATALFGGLATLAAVRLRSPWRYPVAVVLALVPFAVAASRLYAGMHYPSDVTAGLLNGAGVLLVMAHALLPGRSSSPPGRPSGALRTCVSATRGDVGDNHTVRGAARHPELAGMGRPTRHGPLIRDRGPTKRK
ncbi:phosphatase PAP2 family protein [Streptomyces sp. NPDC006368]|uniref:phosphatase PAP2 family protein n=1 Tax=Streptomyces sp. NPDC006368 TaxID=3156760 RepID=UPI0033ADEF7E